MSHTLLKAVTAMVVVLAAAALSGGTFAQDKKAKTKSPACNAVKAEAACSAREDCTWVAAAMKDGKQMRRAYCRAKPKSKNKA